MATRIDIEITSDKGDGTYTWRAAGAKQPKGTFESGLLPDGAAVGDVLRADAEFTVDGPELLAILPAKAVRGTTIETLELISTASDSPGVTTQLAGKGGRRPDRGRGRDSGRGRSDRSGGGGGRDGGGRDGKRRDGNRSDKGGQRGPRRSSVRARRTHREAWVATVAEGRRPVAEQLMHEGRDGVVGALERQNRAAKEAGGSPIDIAPIMRIADQLAPALAVAEWRDQADAAIENMSSADLRDLRRIAVQGEQFAHDPACAETRKNLLSRLNARIDSDQATWSREVREALAEGRTVRALRHSGRPARPGQPLPGDLVESLTSAALEALDPEEESHRWTTVIEALAQSPVRRLVAPAAKPEDADDDLLDTVDRYAERVPAIAELFGIEVKPRRRGGRR